jgi:plasmid stability protein
MATLTIRKLDDDLKEKLRVRAALHGRSMEAEVREILQSTLESPVPEKGFGTWLHEQFREAGLVGLNLELPPRTEPARFVDFDE